MTFYAAADIAFVGGSLVRVGGTTCWSGCARLPILSGPNTFNAESIARLLIEVEPCARARSAGAW